MRRFFLSLLCFALRCFAISHWMAIGHWSHSTIAYLITHSSHTAPKCMFVMVSKDNFNEIVTINKWPNSFHYHFFQIYFFSGFSFASGLNFIVFGRRCLHRRTLSSLISWLSWLVIQVFWFVLFIWLFSLCCLLLFSLDFLDKFFHLVCVYFIAIFPKPHPDNSALSFQRVHFLYITVWC